MFGLHMLRKKMEVCSLYSKGKFKRNDRASKCILECWNRPIGELRLSVGGVNYCLHQPSWKLSQSFSSVSSIQSTIPSQTSDVWRHFVWSHWKFVQISFSTKFISNDDNDIVLKVCPLFVRVCVCAYVNVWRRFRWSKQMKKKRK